MPDTQNNKYRAIVLKAVSYARRKSSAIDRSCGIRWTRSLGRMTRKNLLRQVRRMIAKCDERSISRLYNQGVFAESWECLRIAAETVISRGTSTFWILRGLMTEYYECLNVIRARSKNNIHETPRRRQVSRLGRNERKARVATAEDDDNGVQERGPKTRPNPVPVSNDTDMFEDNSITDEMLCAAVEQYNARTAGEQATVDSDTEMYEIIPNSSIDSEESRHPWLSTVLKIPNKNWVLRPTPTWGSNAASSGDSSDYAATGGDARGSSTQRRDEADEEPRHHDHHHHHQDPVAENLPNEHYPNSTYGKTTAVGFRKFRVNEGASTSGIQHGGHVNRPVTDNTDEDGSTVEDDSEDDSEESSERIARENSSLVEQPGGVNGVGSFENGSSLTEDRFQVISELRKYYKRFEINGRQIVIKIKPVAEGANPVEWLEGAFRNIHAYATGSCRESDYIGISFNAGSFNLGAAGLSFRPVKDLRYEDLWKIVYGVTQSASEFTVDQTITVTVNTV